VRRFVQTVHAPSAKGGFRRRGFVVGKAFATQTSAVTARRGLGDVAKIFRMDDIGERDLREGRVENTAQIKHADVYIAFFRQLVDKFL
jgi:hypothetical protein